jgi:hypothetical protein
MTALLSTFKITTTDDQKNDMPMEFTEGVVRLVFICTYGKSVLTLLLLLDDQSTSDVHLFHDIDDIRYQIITPLLSHTLLEIVVNVWNAEFLYLPI